MAAGIKRSDLRSKIVTKNTKGGKVTYKKTTKNGVKVSQIIKGKAKGSKAKAGGKSKSGSGGK